MPTNTAAWINAKNARLEVGPAPYIQPGDDQIVIRNHAVAINPLDWIIKVEGNLTYGTEHGTAACWSASSRPRRARRPSAAAC